MLVDFGVELGHSNFEDHIRLECLLRRDDLSTDSLVGFISDGGVKSSSRLNKESAAVFFGDSLDSVGSNRNSFFVFIDLLGDTNGNFFGIETEKVLGGSGEPCTEEATVDHGRM